MFRVFDFHWVGYVVILFQNMILNQGWLWRKIGFPRKGGKRRDSGLRQYIDLHWLNEEFLNKWTNGGHNKISKDKLPCEKTYWTPLKKQIKVVLRLLRDDSASDWASGTFSLFTFFLRLLQWPVRFLTKCKAKHNTEMGSKYFEKV